MKRHFALVSSAMMVMEVLAQSSVPDVTTGCTNPNSCNFNPESITDDGSCLFLPELAMESIFFLCTDSLEISAPSDFDNYLWSTGDTSPSIIVFDPGEYSLEVGVGDSLPGICDYQAPQIPDFSWLGTFDDSNYYRSNYATTWNDALEICIELGGHLATLTSALENEFVIAQSDRVFIGLFQNTESSNYSEPNGGWEWVTGEPFEFSYWGYNEPNDLYSENVGEILGTGLMWNDINSSQINPFILELPVAPCQCRSRFSVEVIVANGGCSDPSACNYDESVECDDGSCIYPEIHFDCLGECIDDFDNDGVCDQFEISGCLDANACNFNSIATDPDGSCVYATVVFDCNGNCQLDSNGNGICDQNEGDSVSYSQGFADGLALGLESCQDQNNCGPGTMWDSNFELCLPVEECLGDFNQDGHRGASDLLVLLSFYGLNCD